jgi:ATP synthase protein I
LSDPDRDGDLESLEARLRQARAKAVPEPRQVAASALGQGLRYAMEIVAGTIVGGVIGWGLDLWLGTRPWLAILFLLLGLVAGFRNLMRAVSRDAEELAAQRHGHKDSGSGQGSSGPGPGVG